jgi:hypothetical protein
VTVRGRGSTRTGRGALQPEGGYDADDTPVALAGGHRESTRLVVDFHGEDGRDKVLQVHHLPLPGRHEVVAAALAARWARPVGGALGLPPSPCGERWLG